MNHKIILINTPEHTNIGDHLIVLAEYLFFETYLPTYEICEITSKMFREKHEEVIDAVSKDDIIVITGGGFLGSLWPYSGDNVINIVHEFRENRIIIFPQSMFFDDNDEGHRKQKLLKASFLNHPNLTVCFRDGHSYKLGSELFGGKIQQFLLPDMALLINASDEQGVRNGALLCLRTDKESILSYNDKNEIRTALGKVFDKIDETSMHWGNPIDRDEREDCVFSKIRELKRYRLVVTDTLHCMIACAISGTPCIAINNISNKVEGVYRKWLVKAPYIKFYDKTNHLLRILEEYSSIDEVHSYELKNVLSHFELLVEIITGKSQLYVNTGIIYEDKLYFTSYNTYGLFKYNIDKNVIESWKLIPGDGSVGMDLMGMFLWNNIIWMIPAYYHKIFLYDIISDKLSCLSGDFLKEREGSTFRCRRPLQQGSFIWLFTSYGLYKIDMEKRQVKAYELEQNGFSPMQKAFSICADNDKIYLFGDYSLVFNTVTETYTTLNIKQKEIMYGSVQNGQLITLPIKKDDRNITVYDLISGKSSYEAFTLGELIPNSRYYRYHDNKKIDDLVFYMPYQANGLVVYHITEKKFDIWNWDVAVQSLKKSIMNYSIYDILEYKDNFLIIPYKQDKLILTSRGGTLLKILDIKIPFHLKWDILNKHQACSYSTEAEDFSLNKWIDIWPNQNICTLYWSGSESSDKMTTGMRIWNEVKKQMEDWSVKNGEA